MVTLQDLIDFPIVREKGKMLVCAPDEGATRPKPPCVKKKMPVERGGRTDKNKNAAIK